MFLKIELLVCTLNLASFLILSALLKRFITWFPFKTLLLLLELMALQVLR